MPKTVRKMPQKPRLEQPKKVAAYARVSTGKDAMLHSLSSQVSYYSTIMSSLAQEESRSISENVTWGQRKRFSDGKVSVGYSQFLGFDKGEDGNLKVVPEQAETVRLIYKMFLEGKTTQGIANFLMEYGVLSPAGKETWRSSTIASILTNEKYKGDALLQKRFTPFL